MTIPPDTKPTEPSSLFSLSSLESLAGGTDLLAKGSPTEPDGSGVLDIQALAQATQRHVNPVERESIAPTVPALLTPNLPRAYDDSGWSSGTKLVMAGMGLSILALGGAVAFLALRTPTLPSAEPLPGAVVAANVPAAEAPKSEAPSAPPPAPEQPAAVVAQAADGEEPAGSEDNPSARPVRSQPARSGAGTSKTENGLAPAPASAPAPSSNASIDSLLDKALGGPVAKPRAPVAAAPGAATPSRDEVLTEMKKIGARVKSCGGEPGGMAIAKVTVAGSTGRVTQADIEGQSDAKVRACITHELSRLKLAPFSAPTFSVTYPFRL